MNRFEHAFRYLAFVVAAMLVVLGALHPAGVLAQSSVYISEIQPSGSSNGTYNADWFEVTNSGTSAVDISGWKMDDSSNAFGTAVALRDVTSIPAGKSAIFFENANATLDPTFIATFCTAWFGTTTPPAGFLIGAYGGSGVGLSGSGDAVNLFDANGSPVTGVAFGAVTDATRSFDNTAGSATVSSLSAGEVNGAGAAANGQETGSPGVRVSSTPVPTVDLSLYVRIGRFDLPEPTRTVAPPNSVLAQEASGVTYNWDTDTLFIVGDGGTSVVQVTKTGQLVDAMTLAPGGSPQGTDFFDPEGITYVGGGKFVMSEERDRQAVLFTYAAGTTLTRSGAQTVKLGTFVPNTGTEGISYDPLTGGFIALKEIDPLGIFQTGIDFAAGTATNGSATTENSINLFNPALAGLLDFADVFALSNLPSLPGLDPRLLVLSQESGKIINIDRSGNISSALTIVSDPGNPLAVPAQQHEGLTMDRNGRLYVVSENGGGDFDHPQLWVYAPSLVPNQAPTALALNNQVNTIAENTSTTARLKVADVVITDDGLGANNLTVSGADAAFFEVDSNGLYIKAGTTLDFENKSSYGVTVNVDDTTVGVTPDATATYSLALTDVVEGPPTLSSVVITEVAPWSSGNSPVGADWFEVTNTGNSPVDMTGWKVDDSSNSFAAAIALTGIATVAPGESVIFLETANLAATKATFLSTWFGASPPPSLQIGSYSGSGIGLSTGGDAVNLYNSTGVLRASVTFGASPAGPSFPTFDNADGLDNSAISLLSTVSVHGAFAAAADTNEIGSPGTTGRLIVSEVAPWSSGNSPVGADWFELTNTTAKPIDITGWKVDDSSESPAAAIPLAGIGSILPGESVIFIETADLAGATTAFLNAWFGANPPAGLRIGSYSGSGIGLSTGGDAINIYNATGVVQASVSFGPSPAGPTFPTFDNAVGLNKTAISLLSSVGVHGALVAVNDANEIGSPGRIVTDTTTIPETTLAGKPALLTNSTTAAFTYSGTDSGAGVDRFECSLDGSVFATCANSGSTYQALGDGSHTFAVRAANHAGKFDPTPASYTWTVDTTPPTIDGHAAVTVSATSVSGAVVTYAPPATHDAVDGTGTALCSPASGTQFSIGDTMVTCSASDSAGNAAALATFTVTVNPPTPGRMNGDGWLGVAGDPTARQRFAFNIMERPTGQQLLRFNFWTVDRDDVPRRTNVFDAISITEARFSDDPGFTSGSAAKTATVDSVTFRGSGEFNDQPGFSFEVTATDRGEPGAGLDTFSLIVKNSSGLVVFTAGGTLGGGNIQSARLPNRHFPPFLSGGPERVREVEATSAAGAIVTYPIPMATDENGNALAVTCSPAPGAAFALGRTKSTCSATDANGRTGSLVFLVIVSDNTPPAFGAAADITVDATSAQGAEVAFSTPAAADVVDNSVAVNCNPASGRRFRIGATVVTCTARDDSQNVATKTFTVTVRDTIEPAIKLTKPADGAEYRRGSSQFVNYSCSDAGSGVASCTGTAPDGAALDTATEGTFTFTVSASDAVGNVTSKTVTYRVKPR